MYKASTPRDIGSVMTSLVFVPVLLYPPLFFSDNVLPIVRIGLYVLLVLYLFSRTKRISKNDVFISFILLMLLSSVLLMNYGNSDGLRTAGSTMLTLLFAWGLRRAVNFNGRIRDALVRFYVGLFTLIPLCSVLSLSYFFILGEWNLFNFDAGGHGTYIFTPFGTLLAKDFSGIVVIYRSFSYFYEPVYLSAFYAANVFLIAAHVKKESRFFGVLNALGGLLTFSYSFIALSLLLYFSKRLRTVSWKSGLFAFLLAAIVVVLMQVDIFSTSSLSDRTHRISLFFDAMSNADMFQLMFGHGFAQYENISMGFSGGLFTTIYEVGFINLMIIIYFAACLINKRSHVLLLFLVTQLVIEPTKLPIFWVLIVVLSILLPSKYSAFPKLQERPR